MRRNILVTSSTGNQASGLIRTFLAWPSIATQPQVQSPASTPLTPCFPPQLVHEIYSEEHEYHIYALTRRPSSVSAKSLGVSRLAVARLHVISGDLNDRRSIERVFKDVQTKDGGIWGVFTVLPFPGLGVDAEQEEKMGKMMADLAVQYSVQCFIYSSAMRLGPKYETDQYLRYSAKAKVNIERYVESLTTKGLNWVILQPCFFMENFEGFKGALAVSILKEGLKASTTISLVAAEDVGRLAAAIFQNHELHKHQSLLVVSEFLTLSEIEEAHVKAVGKSLPCAPKAIGKGIYKKSAKTRDLMVAGLELNHKSRKENDIQDLEQQLEKTQDIVKLQAYQEWRSRHT